MTTNSLKKYSCLFTLVAIIALLPTRGQTQQTVSIEKIDIVKQNILLLPSEGEFPIPSLDKEILTALTEIRLNVQLSSLRLNDLLLAVDCSQRSAACLQKIGNNINVSSLFLSDVSKIKNKTVLTLKWFDVKTGIDLKKVTVPLPLDPIKRDSVLFDLANKIIGLNQQQQKPQLAFGGLKISALIPNVEISINAQPRGTAPLTLQNLPIGKYRIVGQLKGYVQWEREVEITSGKKLDLVALMIRSPKGPQTLNYIEAIREHTWVIGGVGLASLVVGLAFGANVRALQNDLDSTQGLNKNQIEQMKNFKKAGQRDALAANILLGAGGSLVITAAVLSYFDYRRAKPEPQKKLSLSPNIQIGPTSAWLGWDF